MAIEHTSLDANLRKVLLAVPSGFPQDQAKLLRYAFRGPVQQPAWGSLARGKLMLLLGRGHRSAVRLAGAIETAHHASLLVDDLIDRAVSRRGADAFWVRYGPAHTILAAHLLVARAIDHFAKAGFLCPGRPHESAAPLLTLQSMAAAEIRSATTSPTTLEEYIQVASGKTGAMFELIADIACEIDPNMIRDASLLRQGMLKLGIAKQISDDYQDATVVADRHPFETSADAVRNRELSVFGLERYGVSADSVHNYYVDCVAAMTQCIKAGLADCEAKAEILPLCSSIAGISPAKTASYLAVALL